MPALTWEEKLKQRTLYEIGYEYLVNNFSKFKETNKIKVALEVISIFNKDGSKTSDGKQVIYVINGDNGKAEVIERDTLEVLPAPSTAEDTKIQEQI